MPTVYEVFFGPTNRGVTLKLLRYSAAMFVLPITVYFLVLHLVFRGDRDKVGWSGIAAVITANVVVAAYVFSAWNEDPEDGLDQKRDKRDGKSIKGNRVD